MVKEVEKKKITEQQPTQWGITRRKHTKHIVLAANCIQMKSLKQILNTSTIKHDENCYWYKWKPSVYKLWRRKLLYVIFVINVFDLSFYFQNLMDLVVLCKNNLREATLWHKKGIRWWNFRILHEAVPKLTTLTALKYHQMSITPWWFNHSRPKIPASIAKSMR